MQINEGGGAVGESAFDIYSGNSRAELDFNISINGRGCGGEWVRGG